MGKTAIMQPYFFPYIGYFQLMNTVDLWVAFDDTQFVDKGWVNRNRVLHPEEDKAWQFITFPLSKRGQFDCKMEPFFCRTIIYLEFVIANQSLTLVKYRKFCQTVRVWIEAM